MTATCITNGQLAYPQGTDSPDAVFWWLDYNDALINFSSGYTFTAQILREDDTIVVNKTTGITGAAGAGSEPSGTPNLTLAWSNNQIDTLAAGRYTLRVVANNTASGKDRILQLELLIRAKTATRDWSYSGLAATSSLDAVRLLIGDTDENDPLLYDTEINYFISIEGGAKVAAAAAARAIAAKFARLADRSIGALSISYTKKYTQYMELAALILQQSMMEPVAPFMSGWSDSDKRAREADWDREELFGKKRGMDNPTVGDPDYNYTTVRGY